MPDLKLGGIGHTQKIDIENNDYQTKNIEHEIATHTKYQIYIHTAFKCDIIDVIYHLHLTCLMSIHNVTYRRHTAHSNLF